MMIKNYTNAANDKHIDTFLLVIYTEVLPDYVMNLIQAKKICQYLTMPDDSAAFYHFFLLLKE